MVNRERERETLMLNFGHVIMKHGVISLILL